ncbi:MAG: patatin-like phospholipase family protein [Bdellovibrionaceae bacterium]|nr:patatin-like phospholipase family protein [Pseudobdellovibrionaceae bacterium]
MGIKLSDKKKIGLVLSGGGIKAAAFHIGVCLALKEKGFRFYGGSKNLIRAEHPGSQTHKPMTIQLYVGSSAGSFVSTILAAGYPVESLITAFQIGLGVSPEYSNSNYRLLKPLTYGRLFNMNKKGLMSILPTSWLQKSLVSGGFESLIKNGFKLNGLFSTAGVENYLRKYVLIENDFSSLASELYIVSTQLNNSRKAIFGNFKENLKTPSTKYINYATISEAVACSTALPPIFSPYNLPNQDGQERYFYDGEIRETLSAHIAADMGCDLVISSFSMQPYHYTPEIGSLHNYGIPVILNQALYQVLEQKTHKHIEWQNTLKHIYKTIDGYFKQNQLPEEHREKILDIYKTRFKFNPNVEYINITPRPQNYEMFMVDHFSLNPKILERIVKIGFKSAINTLRKYSV